MYVCMSLYHSACGPSMLFKEYGNSFGLEEKQVRNTIKDSWVWVLVILRWPSQKSNESEISCQDLYLAAQDNSIFWGLERTYTFESSFVDRRPSLLDRYGARLTHEPTRPNDSGRPRRTSGGMNSGSGLAEWQISLRKSNYWEIPGDCGSLVLSEPLEGQIHMVLDGLFLNTESWYV